LIKITIERHGKRQYRETVNYVISKTPTDKTRPSDYGSRQEIVFDEKYEPREVTKWADTKDTLLEQEITDSDFDLKAVIKAINGL